MGFRGFIRDIVAIYIGYMLVSSVVMNSPLHKNTLLLYGAFLLLFSVWFMVERMGILPKL